MAHGLCIQVQNTRNVCLLVLNKGDSFVGENENYNDFEILFKFTFALCISTSSVLFQVLLKIGNRPEFLELGAKGQKIFSLFIKRYHF